MAVQFTKLSVSPEVVQTTGTSETAVMSQKAVTDALESAGGGSSGGVVLKSVNIGTTSSQWYSGIKSLLNKGIRDIKVVMGVSKESNYVPVDRHLVDLSAMTHTFDSTSYAAFVSGITYVFSVTAYTSTEIHLLCRIFDTSSPREIGLCVTSSNIEIQLTTHGINTYGHKETFYHGYTTTSSMPGVGTAYYYGTE